MSVLVELDSRRRASLAKIATHDRYLVHEEPGGVLVLEPAVVLTEAELRFQQNPELAAQVADALAHPEQAVPRRRRR